MFVDYISVHYLLMNRLIVWLLKQYFLAYTNYSFINNPPIFNQKILQDALTVIFILSFNVETKNFQSW